MIEDFIFRKELEPTPEQEKIQEMVESATQVLIDRDLETREAIARLHTIRGDHWEPLDCLGCRQLELYERKRREPLPSLADQARAVFARTEFYYIVGQPDDGACVPAATNRDPLTFGKRRGPKL